MVDVTIGGGELGRGFYMGDSIALAATWAVGKFAMTYSVLRVDIDDADYARLNIESLNLARVRTTWRQLQRNGTTHTHIFGVDVVYGPLSTLPHASQHKFESANSAITLNRSVWAIL